VVRIPAIGVVAPVIKLAGPRYGHLAVPSLAQAWDVGWYRFSAVPGRRGNSVFFGHVDTYLGPAVFFDLYLLRPGERIYLDLGYRHEVAYAVRWVKELRKTRFPARAVLGRGHLARLWLITCGGQFNYVTRSYVDNIVVNAGSVRR
jgi:sortase (surface protein transpeptidase)